VVGLAGACLLGAALPLRATTVVEKDLDALCAEADRVFIGTVSSIRARWADQAGGRIETLVTFTNIEPLFGVDQTEVVLRFAGGQVGDVVERVGGMPEFRVGERAVIFALDGRFASPLVGFHQGRFPIQGDGAAASVLSSSYRLVGAVADGARAVGERPRTQVSVPLDDFLSEVRRRLTARRESSR
jgi:hypothetical protein